MRDGHFSESAADEVVQSVRFQSGIEVFIRPPAHPLVLAQFEEFGGRKEITRVGSRHKTRIRGQLQYECFEIANLEMSEMV